MLAGLRQGASLQQDATRLRRWIEMLRHLALLMEQGLYALPDALEQASIGQMLPDQTLRTLAEGLRHTPLIPLSELISQCAIPEPEQAAIIRMVGRLGRGTLPERTQAVHQAIDELLLLSAQADDRVSRDVKLWRTLGLTGGACLTLLLL